MKWPLSIDCHAQNAVRHRAVCFAVNEIAPASNALTNEQPKRCNIKSPWNTDFLTASLNTNREQRTNHAVNSDAALPNRDDIAGMLAVIVPLPYDIVNSGAYNCCGQGNQYGIK